MTTLKSARAALESAHSELSQRQAEARQNDMLIGSKRAAEADARSKRKAAVQARLDGKTAAPDAPSAAALEDLALEIECLVDRQSGLAAAVESASSAVTGAETEVRRAQHASVREFEAVAVAGALDINERLGPALKKALAAAYVANIVFPNPDRKFSSSDPDAAFGPLAGLARSLRSLDCDAAVRPSWSPKHPGTAHDHEPIVGVDEMIAQVREELGL